MSELQVVQAKIREAIRRGWAPTAISRLLSRDARMVDRVLFHPELVKPATAKKLYDQLHLLNGVPSNQKSKALERYVYNDNQGLL